MLNIYPSKNQRSSKRQKGFGLRCIPLKLSALGLCLLTLQACRGVDDDPDFVNDGGDLSVYITDGPTEVAHEVVIQVQGMEIQPVSGDVITIDLSDLDPIDLLDLQGEEREKLFDDFDLAPGNYQSFKLILADTGNYIRTTSGQYDLTIPAAEQDSLQINLNLEVEDDTDLDFTIDFDLRKSLRNVGPDTYELHPRARLVDTEETGSIQGVVADSLVNDTDCDTSQTDDRFGSPEQVRFGNVAYVFSGSGANVQDIRDGVGDPVATATVEFDSQDRRYEFLVAFLPQGNYTVAFTCNAVLDQPDSNDSFSMEFTVGEDVKVEAGETANVQID